MRMAAAALVMLAGCATVPPAGHLAGSWGGDQVALEIAADGSGRIELSCASAEFAGPVKLDIGGHFLTSGRFFRGTGVAMVEPPLPVPANISGRLDANGTLWLDIALRDSYPVRSAKLKRGAEPVLMRCL